jgi:hypothetical protein
MKTFLKIFTLVVLAQLAGHLSLAVCTCDGLAVANTPANAALTGSCAGCIAGGTGSNCSWDGLRTCPDSSNTSLNLPNPLGGTVTVPGLIRNIINAALGIVGSLALLMFIYGGFTWMLAAGNEQAVEKGKNILTWATVGLVVIFASYSLVDFVIKAITQGGG